MNRFMKLISLVLCVVLAALFCCSCTKSVDESPQSDDLHIFASVFPIYAITEALAEGVDDVYLHCLVQPQDGCIRDYQLSDWDLTLLTRSADMVIIGGRGLESFENTLYNLGENGPAVAAVLYNKELLPAAIEGGEDDPNHWQDVNPHLYMSTEGAALIAETIAAQLATADPENAELYRENLDKIENKLQSIMDIIKSTAVYFNKEKVILMNETAVYIAGVLGLEAELCVARDSGEAYFDYELEMLIDELKKCESRVILIEKQAPERFCEALEDAGFTLAKIDTFSTRRTEEGFEAYISGLSENMQAVQAAFEREIS